MHPHDPQASGSPMRDSGLLPGKFGFFRLFWGLLTRSDLFVCLYGSFVTLCAGVHALDASVWTLGLSGSPMRDSA